MSFSANFLHPQTPQLPPSPRPDDYDDISQQRRPPSPRPAFLYLPQTHSGRTSVSSTANSTPVPSRSTSPLPQFFISHASSSSCSSETEKKDRRWWTFTRRKRRRGGGVLRTLKKWTRRIVRHPLVPQQPITIILTLMLLTAFAIFLRLLLIYIFNPDKEPLPWRGYCSIPSMASPTDYIMSSAYPYPYPEPLSTGKDFPPENLDSLPPAGLFVGVFSIDSAFERRSLIRSTWASHPRSREGAGSGDNGVGTSRSVVRFILGQPRKDWEQQIQLEMELYNDLVILPVSENMNGGKTHAFFSWASLNAWVPPLFFDTPTPPLRFSYLNLTTPPPALAPHDSVHAWKDQDSGRSRSWVRPDYVVKVDDDSFVMMAELESRLRVSLHETPKSHHPNHTEPHLAIHPKDEVHWKTNHTTISISPDNFSTALDEQKDMKDPLIYWGYLVTNRLHRFMAGELYALSWSLVDWVAKDPTVKGVTKGAEDKQTAKWMTMHPLASEIRWASERCWIYDHPRSGTVYAHGFLFPSEVTRVKRSVASYLANVPQEVAGSVTVGTGVLPAPTSWAHSSVSTFGVRYSPPVPSLSTHEAVEALVEGSDMSTISEGSAMSSEYAWSHREGRKTRYENSRLGGTIVVHFIKKNLWFLETALALLGGEEYSESESIGIHLPNNFA
ncbi:glycosyltransferase family 31 protein [Desarmillaria tabescens]|uniref:Glycosyltransferase family 31 protein n=1 Tax=Armillaria tabescens TaxID=1929756 RepID=A0AA39NGJ4_ARMTA|nr:glycosyltransferase family 31 protein [Desarmillaria tabescens]KAK0465053.1 glycosyltransferase family 31 protein [Desarmillaria tabescens]